MDNDLTKCPVKECHFGKEMAHKELDSKIDRIETKINGDMMGKQDKRSFKIGAVSTAIVCLIFVLGLVGTQYGNAKDDAVRDEKVEHLDESVAEIKDEIEGFRDDIDEFMKEQRERDAKKSEERDQELRQILEAVKD